MKKLIVLAALVPLAFLVAPSGKATGSNTACFDWSCTGTYPSTCSFDSSCSVTVSGTPWQQNWTWGDGTSNLLPPSTATHVYTDAYPEVTLLKYHFGGNSPSVTCDIVARNVIAPPQPLSGRCQ